MGRRALLGDLIEDAFVLAWDTSGEASFLCGFCCCDFRRICEFFFIIMDCYWGAMRRHWEGVWNAGITRYAWDTFGIRWY